jgi:hypothetical protein
MATFVGHNLPPTVPLPITQDVLDNLKKLTLHGVRVGGQVTSNTTKQIPSPLVRVAAGVTPRLQIAQVYLPPPVLSQNNFVTLNFNQVWTGTWTSTASGLVRTVNASGPGSGGYPGPFNGTFYMVNNATGGGFQPNASGIFSITATGHAQGIRGQPLNGTMQLHFTMGGSDPMSGNLSGSIQTFPGGKVTGNLSGTHPYSAYQSHTTMSISQIRR